MLGKRCTKCGQWKLLKEFYRKKDGKSGRTSRCKKCSKAINRQQYKKHRKARLEYSRRYHETHREKDNARNRQYYQEHHAEIKAHKRRYHKEHREECNARSRQYSKKHREKLRAYNRQWLRDNPDKKAANKRRRRASKRNAEGSHTAEEWLGLCKYYDWRCLACGTPHEESPLTVDHIVPLSKGGSDFIDNIQPLCQSCNSRKGTKTIDFREVRVE